MKEAYVDILSLTDRDPVWYDPNGTPRYCEYLPEVMPDVYARVIVFMRIACQCCGRQFNVGMSAGTFDWLTTVKPREWHYGDPPRHNCLGAGETMNCTDIAVLRAWHRTQAAEWVRCRDEEGLIDQEG
jgi:hypothetical protein